MQLSKLIAGLPVEMVKGPTDVEVKGLCHDSRLFKKGDLFIAIRGHQYDGHFFLNQAVQSGVCGLVVEDEKLVPIIFKGAVIKVKDARTTVDILASVFYDYPSSKVFLAGVTGTNGKTTTTHMIESILLQKLPTAIMGTIDYRFQNHKLASSHTTPDGIQTQKLFSDWVKEGAQAICMEVSSHALALHRIDSLQFDVAVFTNLTRDHLDFHITMEAYEQAKAKLFQQILKKSEKKSKRAVVNGDDPHCRAMICKEIPTWIYGKDVGDFHIEKIKLSLDHTDVTLATPVGTKDLQIKMIGLHNTYNAMAAMGVGLHAGFSIHEVADALSALKFVPGRLQRVDSANSKRVFVDYAHSEDALRNVLGFLKVLRDQEAPKNKIITVFGCGGDRDKGKRPMMMKTVQTLSDLAIVTSDNPRTENPETIIDDILQGATPAKVADGYVLIEPDRRKAIELAIQKADAGDVVLIAGKGHENYQIIGTQKFPFDDYLIAEEFLK